MVETENVKQDLIELDAIIEERDLTEEEDWVYVEAKKKLQELEECRAKDIRQKSRVRWAKNGDENTRFFHCVINKRRVANSIPGLEVDGVWVHKPQDVKKEVHRFFRKKISEDIRVRPKLVGYGLKTVKEEDSEVLVSQFSKDEIKAAVFECGGDKAPGPDGFNFRFIKKYWSLFATDFLKIFEDFYANGVIIRVLVHPSLL